MEINPHCFRKWHSILKKPSWMTFQYKESLHPCLTHWPRIIWQFWQRLKVSWFSAYLSIDNLGQGDNQGWIEAWFFCFCAAFHRNFCSVDYRNFCEQQRKSRRIKLLSDRNSCHVATFFQTSRWLKNCKRMWMSAIFLYELCNHSKNPMVICFLWSEFSLQNQLFYADLEEKKLRRWIHMWIIYFFFNFFFISYPMIILQHQTNALLHK